MRNGSFLVVRHCAGMRDTSTRLLALLSLLQARPDWRGTELATPLEVTTPTTRGPDNTDSDAPDPEVAPAVLAALAAAVHEGVGLRVAALDDAGAAGPARLVDPYRLVSWQRRWVLVVREPGPWQVLRVDPPAPPP